MSEHIARARAVIAKALREIWEADDVTWNPEAGDIVRALDAAGLLVTPEREAAAGFEVSEEWRVVGMDGPHSRVSGTYPEREFVDRIREMRGGVVQRRKVAATEWEPEPHD